MRAPGRLVGPAKIANLDEPLFPFCWLALPAAGNANRWLADKQIHNRDFT